jgi:hypothetical protein
MKTGTVAFTWEIDLSTLVSRKVEVETIEGIKRTGKLKEIRFSDPIVIDGRECRYPVEIKFMDDEDLITFNRLKSIRVVRAGQRSS